MKKFLFVLAIGAFAACNNSGGVETPKGDSTVGHDTTHLDTTAKMSADTTSKMAADTTKKDTATKK